jgi:hypothetical protein
MMTSHWTVLDCKPIKSDLSLADSTLVDDVFSLDRFRKKISHWQIPRRKMCSHWTVLDCKPMKSDLSLADSDRWWLLIGPFDGEPVKSVLSLVTRLPPGWCDLSLVRCEAHWRMVISNWFVRRRNCSHIVRSQTRDNNFFFFVMGILWDMHVMY